MGAPTKYNSEVEQRILDAIALGLTYEQAATSAGIHHDTLREWRKSNPDLSAALEKAAIAGMAARLERIQMAAHEGNWQADAWWLERRFPDQWGRRQRMDINHSGQVDLRHVVQQVQTVLDAVLPSDGELRRQVAQKLIELDGVQSEDGEQWAS